MLRSPWTRWVGNQNTFFYWNSKVFKIDDIFITGILAEKANVTHRWEYETRSDASFWDGTRWHPEIAIKINFFFTSQLNQLIEAEPVLDLERLRYRGLLSAHIPQDIKARFLSFLVKSYIYTYNIYNTYLYTPLCSVLIYLKISKPGLSLSWSKLYYQSVLQLSRVQVLDLAKMGTRVTCLFVVAK